MSRKPKTQLKQTGITPEGKPIYSGLYRFYETHGFPLDAILTCFKNQGYLPDWIDFYLTAREAGMSRERVFSKLEEAISDSFGKEFSDHVIFTLGEIFNPKE